MHFSCSILFLYERFSRPVDYIHCIRNSHIYLIIADDPKYDADNDIIIIIIIFIEWYVFANCDKYLQLQNSSCRRRRRRRRRQQGHSVQAMKHRKIGNMRNLINTSSGNDSLIRDSAKYNLLGAAHEYRWQSQCRNICSAILHRRTNT